MFLWHMIVWEGLLRVSYSAWMILLRLPSPWLWAKSIVSGRSQAIHLARLLVKQTVAPSGSNDTELTQVVSQDHAGSDSPLSTNIGDGLNLLAHQPGWLRNGESFPPQTVNKVVHVN